MELDTLSAGELSLRLAACSGVAGQEQSAVSEARKLLEPLGSCEITPLGSLICRVKTAKEEDAPHLVLEAHIDEIGLVVIYIEETGFLRVAACGGIDRQLLCASRVTVHTKTGPLPGIITSVPPHLQKGKNDAAPEVDQITIDIGYSGEEAKQKVALGDRVSFDAAPRALGSHLISCKALDDRAGCAAVMRAAALLQHDALDCSLSVLLSSMEEIGGQGAGTGVYALKPTHAFCVDVSFGHTPGIEEYRCGKLYEGPMVGIAPILSAGLSDMFLKLAEEKGIPCQREVMGGKTGTDADEIASSRAGVLTALLSIPQRNMHTPVELVAPVDIENTARLLAEGARKLFTKHS